MSYLFYCIKKLLKSPAFWASVVGTAAVCLCSEIYFNSRTNTQETVIGMFAQYTREAFLEDSGLCSYAVFSGGFGVWAAMFAPVLAALSPITIAADERKSGMWRFSLHRAGRARFCGGSCAFVLIAGGLAIMLGYALFGALTAVMFPPISAYSPDKIEMFSAYTFREGSAMSAIFKAGGLPLCVIARLGETFLFGAVSAAAAMLLSAFCENKYIVICTPFFLKYSLAQIDSVLLMAAVSDPENYNEKLKKFANIIHPDGANYFLSYTANVPQIIITNAAFICLMVLCYCVIRGRRLKNET
ncbi:MAG: hypothetical protein K2J77_09535 [Oscillospiraceae bacterium]|nr:hypothetical protein [Oscillospiraceae bacterium]